MERRLGRESVAGCCMREGGRELRERERERIRENEALTPAYILQA